MKIIEVGAGLVFRNGQLLITQRPSGGHLAGLWEFPGGKREPQESFTDCIRRELREELGIDVEVGELIESLTHDYPEKSVHLRFHRCVWQQHEPRALECAAFAWVDRLGLGQYEFPAADARLLDRLRSSPELWE